MEKGLIFTYVLTYGGAAASIFNPFIGLMVYFSFAIISPETMWWWSVPRGSYSRIVAVALLMGWAIQGFGNWKLRGAKWIIYSIIAYWIWAILSWRVAFYPLQSQDFVESFAKTLLPILVGITTIDTLAKLKTLAWVLMLSQSYVAFELNLSYFNGFNRVTLSTGYAGLDNNSLCIALVTGCGLAFFLGLRDDKMWRKWLCFGCAAMCAHVPMFGDSRGGMLGIVVTGVVTFLIIPKQPKHYAIFLLALVIGLRMAGPAVVARFVTVFAEEKERDKSAQSRVVLWANCFDVMLRYPVFGCGPDNWPEIADEYGWKKGKEAHSLWFQIGAEMGFLGIFFLVYYYVATVIKLWFLTRRSDLTEPWLADSARMVIASLAGFGTSASFVSLEGMEIPYYVTLLGAATIKLSAEYLPVQRRLYQPGFGPVQPAGTPAGAFPGAYYAPVSEPPRQA